MKRESGKSKSVRVAWIFAMMAVLAGAPAFGHSGHLFCAWASTTPTIDGLLRAGEWSDADRFSATVAGENGEMHPLTIYVKNNSTYLYLAVAVEDEHSPIDEYGYDFLNFHFDNDNDGVGENGDDALCIRFDNNIHDDTFRLDGGNYDDEYYGGTNDLTGAITHSNPVGYGWGLYIAEYRHPLNTSDDAHDFSLSAGDMVGFRFDFPDGEPVGTTGGYFYWPGGSYYRYDNIADLIVAASASDPNTRQAPVTRDDSTTTPEDTAVSMNLVANDFDVDGNTLSIYGTPTSSHATMTVNGGSITYTPNANYNGVDSFSCTVSDGTGNTATSTVTVTAVQNDSPIANADSASVPEDGSVDVYILANDADPDITYHHDQPADTISLHSVGNAQYGTAAEVGTKITYTPNADYNGTDSFSYSIIDSTNRTATATVTVAVGYVEDSPIATDDTANVNEHGRVTVSVLANDSDADLPYGNVLQVQSGSITAPAHGTAMIVAGGIQFTSTDHYNGTDEFSYTAVDRAGNASTATVSITIAAVADAPDPPSVLLTDGQTDPTNVSRYTPLFSWTFTDPDQAYAPGDWQTYYEIRIRTSPEAADVWNSGMVSSEVPNGAYTGVAELTPNVRYYWSVRVWDKDTLMSEYSADGALTILDIGLRAYDGTETIKIAVDIADDTYPLRIYKNGTTYGIILVDPSDPSASNIHIKTASGIKALKKM